jgi:ABC-type thiamine transport system ATPase subunit
VPDSGARRARTASAEALRKDLVSLVDHLTAEVDVSVAMQSHATHDRSRPCCTTMGSRV